jgi:hypothetical protein
VLEVRVPKERSQSDDGRGSPGRAERPRRGPGRRANDKSARRQHAHGLQERPVPGRRSRSNPEGKVWM